MAGVTVGIVCKPKPGPKGLPVLEELLAWCDARGCSTRFDPVAGELASAPKDRVWERATLPGEVDLVVVLGGDGTLLSVARHLDVKRVPILGVNLGHLGFLTEVSTSEMIPTLEAFLDGKAPIQHRMMLRAELESAGKVQASFHCLNDAVITTAALARMIEVRVEVEGRWLTDMRADGVIFSTPTGSTAYNLSAGGPIVTPDLKALILAPLCPHTLSMRPLVLDAGSTLEVTLRKGEEVLLTADGQKGTKVKVGDVVRITRSELSAPLITSPGRDYFALLREKLNWGAGRSPA